LNEFEEHPPVAPVFWAFRVMVAVGMSMLLVALWFGWTTFVRKQPLSYWQLRVVSLMTWSGWVGVLVCWYVTEIGWLTWLVYGQLATADAVADHGGGTVLTTLIAWLVLYVFILLFYVRTLRYMASKPAASLLTSPQHFPGILQRRK